MFLNRGIFLMMMKNACRRVGKDLTVLDGDITLFKAPEGFGKFIPLGDSKKK